MDLRNKKKLYYFKVTRHIFTASINTLNAIFCSVSYVLQYLHLPWSHFLPNLTQNFNIFKSVYVWRGDQYFKIFKTKYKQLWVYLEYLIPMQFRWHCNHGVSVVEFQWRSARLSDETSWVTGVPTAVTPFEVRNELSCEIIRKSSNIILIGNGV